MAKKREALRFTLPWTSDAPPLTTGAAGIARVVERSAGRQDATSTVLDTPDTRLLRAGITLSHRVIDGVGLWHLGAPTWTPHIPKKLILPLDDSADLPGDFARLIRPITRGMPLSAIASVTRHRRRYALLDASDVLLATIRDDRVTVRRGGVVTARFRESTIEAESAMTPQQREYVVAALMSVGGTPMNAFPTLQQRLGPPATGLSDFPEAAPLRKGASMEELVTSVLAGHLRSLTFALLSPVSEEEVADTVNDVLTATLRDVRGLRHVLDPEWIEHVLGQLAGIPLNPGPEGVSCALAVSESLVSAVRSPRLGDASQAEAMGFLLTRADQATRLLADRCRGLTVESTDAQWASAAVAADQLVVSAGVARDLLGRKVAVTVGFLEHIAGELDRCAAPVVTEVDVERLTSADAWEAGLREGLRRAGVLAQRAAFVEAWPERVRTMSKVSKRIRVPR